MKPKSDWLLKRIEGQSRRLRRRGRLPLGLFNPLTNNVQRVILEGSGRVGEAGGSDSRRPPPRYLTYRFPWPYIEPGPPIEGAFYGVRGAR